MHDPPYITELYELMEELSGDHDADNAALVKREDGPAIVLEWDDPNKSELAFQYDDYEIPPGTD